MKRILSLGAGVQSSTLLLMSISGALPRLDACVFADTQWEPRKVYEYLDWLTGQATGAGIPIYRDTKGDIRADAMRSRMNTRDYKAISGGRWASMPLYTRDRETGKLGQIKRQCTKEYKIQVIERVIRRRILGLAKGEHVRAKAGPVVEQWFGISTDEMRRARLSTRLWLINRYPLISDIPMTRADCLAWLQREGYPSPARSACIGCPFKSNKEWRHLREDSPEEWAEAVALDKAIRIGGGMRGDTFLHRSCIPLGEVDLSTAEDRGQLNWLNECTGACGV